MSNSMIDPVQFLAPKRCRQAQFAYRCASFSCASLVVSERKIERLKLNYMRQNGIVRSGPGIA